MILKNYDSCHDLKQRSSSFNPIQDGPFRGCSRMGGGAKIPPPLLPKICHTCPTVMKLGSVIP